MPLFILYADVVELVDTPDLGSGAARCGGSSPLVRTTPEIGTFKAESPSFKKTEQTFFYYNIKRTSIKAIIFENSVQALLRLY